MTNTIVHTNKCNKLENGIKIVQWIGFCGSVGDPWPQNDEKILHHEPKRHQRNEVVELKTKDKTGFFENEMKSQ